MATELLSSSPFSSFTLPSKSKPRQHRGTHYQSWLEQGRAPKPRRPVVRISLHDPLSSSPAVLFSLAENVGFSLASYYTSLGLFVISVPGLWSLIKRSAKSKIVRKTFIGEEKRAPNQAAGEILSFFTRNNFAVLDRGETVTFEGMMVPSRGQAALLTFCTCISLASVALVLTITISEGGNNWYWMTILSPLASTLGKSVMDPLLTFLALILRQQVSMCLILWTLLLRGVYYWKRASRKEQIKVKMLVGEDGSLSEIIVQGDDQQVEQMRKELQLSEKGMVYVKGIFEK